MTESEFQNISFLFLEKKELETLSTQLESVSYAYIHPADSKSGICISGDVLTTLKSAVNMQLNYLRHKIAML